MPDASVPIKIAGTDHQLRYTYPDFKAMEKDLGVGYHRFLQDEIFRSLNAQEIYLWRGLKIQNPDGRWVPEFPQNTDGQGQAGDLLWSHLQETGEMGTIASAVFEAFCTTGPWKKVKETDSPAKSKGEDPKNYHRKSNQSKT